MKQYYSLYNYILNNIYKLSNKDLYRLLYKLELFYLASMLKLKFNDQRSVEELYQLINEELKLPTHRTIYNG